MWQGRATPFSLTANDDPLFDRRLVLPPETLGGWIVLRYALAVEGRPQRPLLRLRRSGGRIDRFVLPGVALGRAFWLGYLPADCEGIEIAAGAGFTLERVGARSSNNVFAECLAKRPLHAAGALRALLRRDERRWRDSLRGACAVTPLSGYAAWREARGEAPPPETPAPDIRIRLVLAGEGAPPAAVADTLAALTVQSHANWTLHLSGAAPVSDPRIHATAWYPEATALSLCGDADFFGILRPGDRLAPQALALLTASIRESDPDLIYADDEVGEAVPAPRLKPDWSPDLARVGGVLGAPALVARTFLAGLPPRPVGAPDSFATALELDACEATRVVHLPRILCRRAFGPDDTAQRAALLDARLSAAGDPARPVVRDGVLDLHRPRPEPAPLVSIVIPSRDRSDLITRVTADVLERTDYPAIELIVVDNGSTDPAVLALYERLRADPRVRIEPFPHPFNFAAMVNRGAEIACGKILVLLNNDVAVLRPDWLDAMVAQAVRPEVGAVGAKLLYADGRLQHAGVVVGLGGEAGHILRRRPAEAPSHLGRMRVAHEVSAVTAACLAVGADKYRAVGGFDAGNFAVDFNDVDFCLRLGAAGWKTVWTPHAVLSHLESVSRGRPSGAARQRFEREAAAFAERWRDAIRHDPFYHPALSLTTFGEDLE
ncbi:glycosyltransferase family 2 protein [Methylorubrum sp. SB2]|uniref:glycosyltransferase family 2 protein n=1 Tax=Methylorubrum subtropicum TaxID=3138812 RepID=UPI00313CB18A